jgi:hypothetical protein
MGNKNGHGGVRPNSGRKSKAEEQQLVERLSPFQDLGLEKLVAAMRLGEQWAIKMYFEYMYGKPTQRIEQTGKDGQPQQIQIFTVPGPVMPTNEDDIDEDIAP